MISVSSQYKDIMTRYKRNKSYISVGIGIIDQEAQASAQASAETAYWIDLLFETEYLTKEEYTSVLSDCNEIKNLLSSITKTIKEKNNF